MSSVYTVKIFMKSMHVCAALITTFLFIEPDFPCLADEIAEPRPDMNIKVAAFTVREESINIIEIILSLQLIQVGQLLVTNKSMNTLS